MNLWSGHLDGLKSVRLQSTALLDSDDPHISVVGLPQLIPTVGDPRALAALLVPLELRGRITRNGVPLAAGMHLLQHADRVDFAGCSYWVALGTEVREVPYDVAVHGEDQFCFITRVRLRVGEMVVVCPGRPGVGCAAIYRKAAWEMALETNARFRCPRCGFEPAAMEWQPPPFKASNLPRLFELASRLQAETHDE